MTHYINYIRDLIGNNYLGVKIDRSLIEQYLNELKDILGDEYDIFTKYQQDRDNGTYHITTINVADYNATANRYGMSIFIDSITPILKYPIDDIKMMGIGTANRGANTTYFIVCKSDKLKAIRDRYGLPNHDFHITIGFKFKDVFGVRKNEVMDIESKFIQILGQKYLEKENFLFIKRIINYEENPDLEIIPISISKTFLKIKVGEVIMDVGLTDDGQLRLFTKYKDEKDLQRMPTTELLSIITKK